jgi:hypothetical protein
MDLERKFYEIWGTTVTSSTWSHHHDVTVKLISPDIIEKVKRTRDIPPISFETLKHQFFNYSFFFLNKMHIVDTNIKLSMKLEFGLLLRLNFILFPLYQYKQVFSIFTVYLKVSNSSFNILQTLKTMPSLIIWAHLTHLNNVLFTICSVIYNEIKSI